jgi:iron(III) transport system substrate-binding protein
MLEGFTEETGIEVEFRDGNDAELANQIVQEGEASPADVFLTENSPSIAVLDREGLLAPLDRATLDQVGEQFRPSSGTWTGFAARSTVLVYDPTALAEDELPASILELADPAWEGRIGIAAGGADFQAIVSAILATKGEQATATWLAALKSGAKVYQNNIATMKAVNAGQSPMGIIYHYYWYRDQALDKESTGSTKLHYFKNEDPGAFLSLSGGGVLKSSKHAADAQKFLAFVAGKKGQQLLAGSDAKEYAVGTGVPSDPALPSLESLQAPKIDPFTLNGPKVIELMTKAGIL